MEVSPRIFKALLTVDEEALTHCDDQELRPVVASLVRMCLITPLDKSEYFREVKSKVLVVLSNTDLVNSIVGLLSGDLHLLEADVKKEISLRSKPGSSATDSVLVQTHDLTSQALEFERSDAARRLKLVIAELVAIVAQVQSIPKEEDMSGNSPFNSFTIRQSELFDHMVYLPEVCDVIAVVMAEFHNLFSPTEVAESLLRLKYGPEIICCMVANLPDTFRDVVQLIIRNGDKHDEVNCNHIRSRAIQLLCRMNPSQMVPVRSSCVEQGKLPSLVLLLALEDPTTDLVAFMSGILLGSDTNIRSWMGYYIRNAQKKTQSALQTFRDSLLKQLRDLTRVASDCESDGIPIPQKVMIQGAAILRLYTALKGIAGLKLSDDESSSLVNLITCKAPATLAGVKFVSLGLCMFIACNSILSNNVCEKQAVTWIQWLVEQTAHFEQVIGSSASFGEMLLLLSIHFHSNQISAIGDLVCETLGMKIVIRTSGLSKKISHVFTHEIFNEQAVAAHAVKVPVTPALSAKIKGFLPVHCIHQLLKSRAFSKHKVPIKDWILKQICTSTTPVHPVMVAVVEVFVNSIIVPATNRAGAEQFQTNEPITEEEVAAIFSATPFDKDGSRAATPKLIFSRPNSPSCRGASPAEERSNLAAQVLILYYVLLYENHRLAHTKSIILAHRKVLRYSQELFASLPVKFLLQTAEKDQDNFDCIFPQLLRLCSSQFPHLCSVQDWLRHEDDLGLQKITLVTPQRVEVAHMKEALTKIKSCPPKLTMLMQQMLLAPTKQKWECFQLLLMNTKLLLEEETPLQMQDLFRDLWFAMNDLFPRKLWAATVHFMCTNRINLNFHVPSKVTQDDLILDPLQVLRCDPRVFKVAPFLEVVLYLLKTCLSASKVQLQQNIQENPIIDKLLNQSISSDLEREELKCGLISAQDSAAIQILLEAVLKSDKKPTEGPVSRADTSEIKLLCSFIHEVFINDPNLAKLVHFQGYSLEFLPVTVTGIPSMHICLDFLPELLRQPELEKQIFAIDLVSHLSIQFAMPKSYSTARLAVNTMSTLLSVLTREERHELMIPVLPSMVRFCKAFPPLSEDVISVLVHFGKICASEKCLETFPTNKLPSWKSFQDAGDLTQDDDVANKIRKTFSLILENSVLEQRLY